MSQIVHQIKSFWITLWQIVTMEMAIHHNLVHKLDAIDWAPFLKRYGYLLGLGVVCLLMLLINFFVLGGGPENQFAPPDTYSSRCLQCGHVSEVERDTYEHVYAGSFDSAMNGTSDHRLPLCKSCKNQHQFLALVPCPQCHRHFLLAAPENSALPQTVAERKRLCPLHNAAVADAKTGR